MDPGSTHSTANAALAWLGLAASAIAAASCERCRAEEPSESTTVASASRSPAGAPTVPVTDGWRWRTSVGRTRVALPPGCRHRERPLSAEVADQSRWRTDAGRLGALLVSIGEAAHASRPGDAPDGWRPTGAGAVRWTLDASGELVPDVAPVPWLGCPSCPAAYDAASDRWLLAWSERATDGNRRLLLWRGGEVELVAEGDGLEPADLACNSRGDCALCATEPASVAHGGATVWLGRGREAATSWQAQTVELESRGLLVPVALGLTAEADEPELALLDDERLTFVTLGRDGRVSPRGALDAPHGVLAAAPRPWPAAITLLAPVDAGCSAGAPAGFRRPGGDTHALPTPLAPTHGALTRLDDGYFVTLHAPQRCGEAPSIVYGALAANGSDAPPLLIALAEADDIAVAAAGAEVDLFVRRGRSATWVRARCSARATPPDAGRVD